jgi:hypothetical protein
MIYTLDPLTDPRWDVFVSRHESASIFHTRPWLEALRQTYSYTPVVYTTTPPTAPLANGIVLCEIKSWLTGRRLVSLPFSDHCEPLLDGPGGGMEIAEAFKSAIEAANWDYIELRPTSELPVPESASKRPPCYLHRLDLRPPLEEILRRTHKTGVQQPIKRGEREGLVYESGNSERLLKVFYRMMIQTRRRHLLPPQPIQWFRNIAASVGNGLQIRIAFKDGHEIAGIMTVQHKDVIVYKYGCSNHAFRNLGGTACLLWKAITDAKAAGVACMDFGRSDADNTGLIEFKNRWGAQSCVLTYLRWSRKRGTEEVERRSSGFMKQLFGVLPDPLLEATGRILYRHVG